MLGENFFKLPSLSSIDHKTLLLNALKFQLNLFLIASFTFFLTWFVRRHFVPHGPSAMEYDLNFVFLPCVDRAGVCSFPTSNLSAHADQTDVETGRTRFFEYGVAYALSLELELPDDTENRHVGMFMTSLRLYGADRRRLRTYSRSVSLQHHSRLIRWLTRLVLFPLYLLNLNSDNQTIFVVFTKNYHDLSYNEPATLLEFELQSTHLRVYSARARVTASYNTFQCFLLNWPLTSTVVIGSCVASVLVFLSFVYWAQKSGVFLYKIVAELQSDDADETRRRNVPSRAAIPSAIRGSTTTMVKADGSHVPIASVRPSAFVNAGEIARMQDDLRTRLRASTMPVSAPVVTVVSERDKKLQ